MRILYKCLNFSYSLLMMLVLILCVFSASEIYACKRVFQYTNNVYITIGVIFILIALVTLCAFKKVQQSNFIRNMMIVGNGALFIIISIFAYHYYFYTDWDVGFQIIPNAEVIACREYTKIDNYYFSLYPNNILLVFVFSIVIKLATILHIENWYMGLIILQCAIYGIVGWLIYRVADILFKDKCYVLLVWVLYLCLCGFSPWVVIPYSDSVGLLFPVMILYLYLKYKQQSDLKARLKKIVILTIVAYIGYKIKPQIGIITIAIIIISYLEFLDLWWKKEKTRKNKDPQKLLELNLQTLGAVCIGIVIVNAMLVGICYISHIHVDKNLSFGATHFIMMGLNEDTKGVYNQDDVNFSASFTTKEKRRNANFEAIGERLKTYGPKQTLELVRAKILTDYNDGSFAWGCEGKFFIEYFSHGNTELRAIAESIYYPQGQFFNKFLSFVQMNWMSVLFLSLFVFIKREKTNVIWIMMLSVIGLTLFEILFEARARYLFTYVPIYILLACLGLQSVIENVKNLYRKLGLKNE